MRATTETFTYPETRRLLEVDALRLSRSVPELHRLLLGAQVLLIGLGRTPDFCEGREIPNISVIEL